MYAMDELMKRAGYKSEGFGRWSKDNQNTSEGPKKIIIAIPSPLYKRTGLIALSYELGKRLAKGKGVAGSVKDTFKYDPSKTNLPNTIWYNIQKSKTPLISEIADLVKNKNIDTGKHIYNPYDDASKQWMDVSEYALTHLFKLAGSMKSWATGDRKRFLRESTKVKKQLDKKLPPVIKFLNKWTGTAAVYAQKTKRQQLAAQLRSLQRDFTIYMKEDWLKATPEQRQKYIKKYRIKVAEIM